jgi:hypothetical protein
MSVSGVGGFGRDLCVVRVCVCVCVLSRVVCSARRRVFVSASPVLIPHQSVRMQVHTSNVLTVIHRHCHEVLGSVLPMLVLSGC